MRFVHTFHISNKNSFSLSTMIFTSVIIHNYVSPASFALQFRGNSFHHLLQVAAVVKASFSFEGKRSSFGKDVNYLMADF